MPVAFGQFPLVPSHSRDQLSRAALDGEKFPQIRGLQTTTGFTMDRGGLVLGLSRCRNGGRGSGSALRCGWRGHTSTRAARGRRERLRTGSRRGWRGHRGGGSGRWRRRARGQRRQFNRWRSCRLGRQVDAHRFFFRLNLDCFSRFRWNSTRREIWIFSHSFLLGQARVGENSCQILNQDKKEPVQKTGSREINL